MKYIFTLNKVMSKKPYRVISEKVVNPIFQEIPTGSYQNEFSTSSLPSGIYFVSLNLMAIYLRKTFTTEIILMNFL
ncbi:MAG: hypothetical protein C4539_15810 [Ignavibacteriales bacterium]|nr:MAG: hypothetical protein C4539_15810 [Ignavibacteriales bacterium]